MKRIALRYKRECFDEDTTGRGALTAFWEETRLQPGNVAEKFITWQHEAALQRKHPSAADRKKKAHEDRKQKAQKAPTYPCPLGELPPKSRQCVRLANETLRA